MFFLELLPFDKILSVQILSEYRPNFQQIFKGLAWYGRKNFLQLQSFDKIY